VDTPDISSPKILAGRFGGPAGVSLLLCGAHRMVLVPVQGRTDLLRTLASFESQIKDVQYGPLAVGDLNHDGLADVAVCDQAGHHVEILTFGAAGKLVSATKFKVFEEPRAVERSRYDSQQGEPRAVVIADVTGDGKADLILLVHDRIILYPQD
jgi:hypothetical protein